MQTRYFKKTTRFLPGRFSSRTEPLLFTDMAPDRLLPLVHKVLLCCVYSEHPSSQCLLGRTLMMDQNCSSAHSIQRTRVSLFMETKTTGSNYRQGELLASTCEVKREENSCAEVLPGELDRFHHANLALAEWMWRMRTHSEPTLLPADASKPVQQHGVNINHSWIVWHAVGNGVCH